MSKGISIIVPFLNEEDSIQYFCDAFENYVRNLDFDVEVLFVDDGSIDGTVDFLRKYKFNYFSSVKLIQLSKNFGSHAAIRAGTENASYDICTWISCDLQEPLELIPISYNKIVNEGIDVVYVEKKSVKVSFFNRLFSKIYSFLMIKYAVKSYSSGGTATIVYGKKIKDYLNNHKEQNSSIMLQIMDLGYKSYNISLDYGERVAGKSKWTLSKKIKLFIDSFISFSFAPIRLVSIVGIFMFFLGILIGIFTIINKILNSNVPIGYSTLTSVMAMGFGVTNISLGIIAEYLWRAYDAARNRPVYNISNKEVLK